MSPCRWMKRKLVRSPSKALSLPRSVSQSIVCISREVIKSDWLQATPSVAEDWVEITSHQSKETLPVAKEAGGAARTASTAGLSAQPSQLSAQAAPGNEDPINFRAIFKQVVDSKAAAKMIQGKDIIIFLGMCSLYVG